jgi:protein-disulfide isomerase
MSKQSREQSRTERAAAIRAAQARKERNRRIALVAGVLVLLGAIVAGGVWYSGGGKSTATGDTKGVTLAAGDASLSMGDASAPVKVVIYEDFLCPYCRELETSTRDFLQENAAKGKVYVEYHPINLLTDYDYSAKAMNAWAAVLKHASPSDALKLHNLFYDKQPYEQQSDQSLGSIEGWVKDVVGNDAAVLDAMKTQDTAFFAAAQQAMTTNRINSTPTVFLNGKELPNTSGVPQMVSAIETAVQQGGK